MFGTNKGCPADLNGQPYLFRARPAETAISTSLFLTAFSLFLPLINRAFAHFDIIRTWRQLAS